jgi:integrase
MRGRASGTLVLRKRRYGYCWNIVGRTPTGERFHRKLADAHIGGGSPPEGHLTRRQAQGALRAHLADLDRGLVSAPAPGSGVTFEDALQEWLRWSRDERGLKPSTLHDREVAVRSRLAPALGHLPLEAMSVRVLEQWQAGLAAKGLAGRTINKQAVMIHGALKRARRVWGVPEANPAAALDRYPERYNGDYDFYTPEEVLALVRAAEGAQDGALFLTAAYTGLRMGELLALRWGDVDFTAEAVRVRASYSGGHLTTPKSGKVRAVPMVPQVAQALARLADRPLFTDADDLVFPSPTGHYTDSSALRRRFKEALARAGLRQLRFHDLRHTFASLAINVGSITEVQHWCGHADQRTTARYMHYKARADEARRLAAAFAPAVATEAETSVTARRV